MRKRLSIKASLMTPVLPMLVAHFKDFIPKAFPTGNDLILDAEVLLVDTKTGQPLPFGTLGVHKREHVLLAGSPKLDRSKGRGQTNVDHLSKRLNGFA
nr:hypothetical protein BaRGS_017737 [Batillaria attramentaria]